MTQTTTPPRVLGVTITTAKVAVMLEKHGMRVLACAGGTVMAEAIVTPWTRVVAREQPNRTWTVGILNPKPVGENLPLRQFELVDRRAGFRRIETLEKYVAECLGS